MGTHRIHLRGFWETKPLDGGRARHLRRFGQPRVADPAETVWVVGDVPGAVTVFLNGERLGTSDGAFAFEVTAKLQPRNELVVEADGPLGEVAVEVCG